jgi:hypothetical protein
MAFPPLTRRTALAGASALGVASIWRPREALATKQLNVVLESEVIIFDPHFTTAAITRTFGYHIWDTLFSMDGKGQIRPQMVEAFETSPDKLTWTFTLSDGLKWHDGRAGDGRRMRRLDQPLVAARRAGPDAARRDSVHGGDGRQDLLHRPEGAVPADAAGARQGECAAAGDDADAVCLDARRPAADGDAGGLGPVPVPGGSVEVGQLDGDREEPGLRAAQGAGRLPGGVAATSRSTGSS